MGRIRSIKPEFWEDELIGSISREARLLFIAIWCAADDHGRFSANPARLKAAAFAYDEDVTLARVAEFLRELLETRRVGVYRVENQTFGVVRHWKKHQRIDNASKPRHPPPPDGIFEETLILEPHSETRGEIPRVSLVIPLEQGAGSREQGAGTLFNTPVRYKNPVAKKPATPPHPNHHPFIYAFDAAFRRVAGESPTWDKQRLGMVKVLVRKHPLPKLLERLDVYFGPTCPHWLQTGRDLGSFVKNIDKLIPALGPKSDGSPDYEAEGWTIDK